MQLQCRLSIIIPFFNEERTLGVLIGRVHRACPFAEVILVDDGSTDRSLAIARTRARPEDIVLTKKNGGKGSAVRMGYARAMGRYVIVQDADLEYSPEEIPLLLAKAEESNLPAVFGSRRLKAQRQYAHLTSFIGGSFLTHLCNILYGSHLTDQPTCYKMVRTDTLRSFPLRANDFRFDPELTAHLLRRGIPILEYPISYVPRTFREGKKIGLRDWFLWVWEFVRLRLVSVDGDGKKFPSWAFLVVVCATSAILWFPAVRYPIVSDTAIYALLGESVWTGKGFALFNIPHAKYLPLHAILSYPITAALGPHVGMKVSSLLAGIMTLILSFILVNRYHGFAIAGAVTVLLLLHPAFVVMTMLGSADLLFTSLFLLFVLAFLRSSSQQWWYLIAGAAVGLSTITRYNGVPLLFLFFFFPLLFRPMHHRSPWFWGGICCGGAILGTWFLRNALVFGSPFYTEYTTELAQEAPSLLRQFVSNILYYGNPFHNVFPALFPFALYGLWRFWRQELFFLLAFLVVELLTAVWWVQATRFAFPGFLIPFLFAVLGVRDALSHIRFVPPLLIATVLWGAVMLSSAGTLCLYTYGACNAWFDRTVGLLPSNMGFSTEGFFTWDQARHVLNRIAPTGASVAAQGPVNARVWARGVFRDDLHVLPDGEVSCGVYAITQEVRESHRVLFTTADAPRTFVVVGKCAL